MHSLELTDSGQQNQHVLAQENEYIIMAATWIEAIFRK